MNVQETAALDRLIEDVDAGEWVATGDGNDSWIIIFDAGLRRWHEKIHDAWHGDTKAAFSLLALILPGWRVSLSQELEIIGSDDTFVAIVAPMDSTKREHVFRPSGRHKLPARALLLAMLRAYRATAPASPTSEGDET